MYGKEHRPDQSLSITDEVEAIVYSFSDYVSCIDLYLRGVCVSTFCSDHSTIDEYLEEPNRLLKMLKLK